MEIINIEEEFSRPSPQKIDFLIELGVNLKQMAEIEGFNQEQIDTVQLAAHHIMVLLSQVIAGSELFALHRWFAYELADALQEKIDLAKQDSTDIRLVEVPSVLKHFKELIESYENEY